MKKQDKLIMRRILLTLFAVLFVGWFLFWPLNKYIESPGTADSLRSYVKIKGHPDKQKGSFMITSVYLQQARPATYLWAKLTPYNTIESKQAVTGGQNNATFDKVQDFYMQSAINEAIANAYKAAHQEVSNGTWGSMFLKLKRIQNSKKILKLVIR